MKDLKIQGVRPAIDPKAAEKSAPRKSKDGTTFENTLQTTLDRMSDLKNQADQSLTVKESPPDSISEEITTAREMFDRMMLEKKNLSLLYNRIKTQEETP